MKELTRPGSIKKIVVCLLLFHCRYFVEAAKY